MVLPDTELEFEMLIFASEKTNVKFSVYEKCELLELWINSKACEYNSEYLSHEWGDIVIINHQSNGLVADRLLPCEQ